MAEQAVRRIRVADHAVQQYRQRLIPEDKRNKTIRNTIVELVRCGLSEGNSANHKPKGFLLYGQKSGVLPPDQRFIWCSEKPNVGFLVVIGEPEGPFVKTTLVRVGVNR
jgi:hypothetical protein